jgi:hypothetical protein
MESTTVCDVFSYPLCSSDGHSGEAVSKQVRAGTLHEDYTPPDMSADAMGSLPNHSQNLLEATPSKVLHIRNLPEECTEGICMSVCVTCTWSEEAACI